MKLELFQDRVVVKVEGIKTTLIIIPVNSREGREGLVGEVIEIGPDCTKVKLGDKVFYARYSGFFMPFPRDEKYKECKLMSEEDILAIITEEN